MKNKLVYINLETLTMDHCSLTKLDYEQARSSWLCMGCSAPKPNVHEIDVILQESPVDKPLTFVNGCGLGIVYRQFLEKFPTEVVSRDLYLGRVFGPDGKRSDAWITFRGRQRLIIRGSKEAGVRKCEMCNRDVYFAMGKKYLYPPPSADVTLFESHRRGLVLPKDLFSQLDLGKWPKLDIEELPVLDVPKDGLGELNT